MILFHGVNSLTSTGRRDGKYLAFTRTCTHRPCLPTIKIHADIIFVTDHDPSMLHRRALHSNNPNHRQHTSCVIRQNKTFTAVNPSGSRNMHPFLHGDVFGCIHVMVFLPPSSTCKLSYQHGIAQVSAGICFIIFDVFLSFGQSLLADVI